MLSNGGNVIWVTVNKGVSIGPSEITLADKIKSFNQKKQNPTYD